MKSKKLVQKLNSSLEDASKCMTKHNKMLGSFLKQIKAAETGLLKQLHSESKKSKKKKLKKKLSLVKSAYASLR